MDFYYIARWLSFIFFGLAGIIHVGFFLMESVFLEKPAIRKIFKISDAEFSAVKVWAFNQGFYNLFLGIGNFLGLSFIFKKQVMLAGWLTGFSSLSMIVAGTVLWFSASQMRRGALLQIIPPLLGFLFLFFHVIKFF